MRRLPIALLFACVLNAQTPVFHARTDLRTIAVEVSNKQGVALLGLQASDFTLLEDGKPQKISFFAAVRQPVSLAIVLDTSRSMDFGGKLERARELLAPLVRESRPQDEIFFMPFTDVPGRFRRIGADDRSKPIPLERVGHGGSAVYDALATALCRMRNAANVRQAVVVLTDGVDEHSRLHLEQLIDLIASSRPQVFMIGLYDKPAYEIFREGGKTITIVGLHEIDNPLYAFRQLARESGAEAFFPSSKKDLQRALERMYGLLETQYSLAYYPQRPDVAHRIEVRVKRRGAIVSARTRIGPADSTLFRSTGCEVSAEEHPFPWEQHVRREGGQMTYRDDFSDAHSGWPNLRFDPATHATAHYTQRGYELYRFGEVVPGMAPGQPGEIAAGSDTAIAAYGPLWKNFRATLALESQSFAPSSGAGLVVDVNERGYYALLLNGKQGKRLSFAFVKGSWNGKRLLLLPWTPLDPAEHAGKAHHLTVEGRNGAFALSIDGRLAGRAYDNGFPAGLIGFGVFGEARALVHDLRIEALP